MNRRHFRVWAWLAGAALALGCRPLRDDAAERTARAERGPQEIAIAVAWPRSQGGAGEDAPEPHFWHGVTLAEKELAAKGGVLGRPLRLVPLDEGASIAQGKVAAQRVVDDLDVVAVIGHRDSSIAMVTSVMYEYANVVMIAAGSSASGLTRDGFDRIFRTLPSEEEASRRLADHAHAQGLKSVLICFENDVHGRMVANAFEARAEVHRLSIVDRLSFDRGALRSLEQSLRELRGPKVDAVLLGARLPEAAEVVQTLRRAGVVAPILAADGLDSRALATLPEAEGSIVASVFSPEVPETQPFVGAYEKAYGHPPDTWAMQGYDALMLVAQAIGAAQSATPAAIAATLRRPEGWTLSAGQVRFDRRGGVAERRVHFRTVGRTAQDTAPR